MRVLISAGLRARSEVPTVATFARILSGSGKWVRDVVGIVVGTLVLIGLLARLFVACRRRRAAVSGDAHCL